MIGVSRAERRRTGSVYTPAPLAARVVRRALGPLVRGDVLRLRICDPACGEGVFLVEACRFLAVRGGVAEAEVARRCLMGVDVDPAALARAARRLPGATLVRGDALIRDWGGDRFDAVVGNPPWVSYSGRHAQPLSAARRAELAARYTTLQGWPSLHGLFLELAVRLSRGRVGVLLPAQVCDLEGYAPVRAFVRRHCRVDGTPLDCGEVAFRGVTQPACALFLQRGPGEPGGGGPIRIAGRGGAVFSALERPPPEAFGDIGVHTGNCASKVLRPGGAPLREGKDVTPYQLRPPRRGFRRDAVLAPGEYFRAGPLARYRRVPILLRQTAGRPVAARHTEPGYFRNSVLACFGIPGWPHEVTVAWLNSRVIAEYHGGSVREAAQRAFPQVKLRHLRDLPVPPLAAAPGELTALARAVARDGWLSLADELDEVVRAWFERAVGGPG